MRTVIRISPPAQESQRRSKARGRTQACRGGRRSPPSIRPSSWRKERAPTMIRSKASLVSLCLWCSRAIAFSIFEHPTQNGHAFRKDGARGELPHWAHSPRIGVDGIESLMSTGRSYSTLTLLEHIHLLTPNVHHSSTMGKRENMVDFFVETMGFGLDPKSVDNINNSSGVVFVNCGPSQVHLNDDADYCAIMDTLLQESREPNPSPLNGAFEIGLSYEDMLPLKERLSKAVNLCSYQIEEGRDGREAVRITDNCGRTFVARESGDVVKSDSNEAAISSICQQRIIHGGEQDLSQYGAKIVDQYGASSQSLCRGMDYIEFFVPVHTDDDGRTVEKIAKFYDFFFDAPTTVAHDGTSPVAIIGVGAIDENGRAEQSLLFRERPCDNPPEAGVIVNDDHVGTGHHIAIYVGANDEDFEAAASNFMEGGLLWVNSQFEDRVLDVESALKVRQFRFKNIIDIENGEVLYALEHEIRAVSHDLFPLKE